MFRRLFIVSLIISVVLGVGWLSMRRADIPFDTLEKLYTSPSSQFMTLQDGLKVHYRDEGNRDGKPIVLVHGFSASLHTWEPWVEELKGDYRLISLDLPGHGFGATAWQFALSRQECIDGLVLIAASGWQEQQIIGDQPMIFQLLANKHVRSLIKDFDLKALIRSGLKDSFIDQSLVTEDMVSRYAYLARGPEHRAGILALMSGEERMPASAQALSRIDVPTLILQGDSDVVVSPSGAPKFHAAIPNSELIVYKNVGHLPQEEVTDQSVADLRSFLVRRVWPVAASDALVIAENSPEG